MAGKRKQPFIVGDVASDFGEDVPKKKQKQSKECIDNNSNVKAINKQAHDGVFCNIGYFSDSYFANLYSSIIKLFEDKKICLLFEQLHCRLDLYIRYASFRSDYTRKSKQSKNPKIALLKDIKSDLFDHCANATFSYNCNCTLNDPILNILLNNRDNIYNKLSIYCNLYFKCNDTNNCDYCNFGSLFSFGITESHVIFNRFKSIASVIIGYNNEQKIDLTLSKYSTNSFLRASQMSNVNYMSFVYLVFFFSVDFSFLFVFFFFISHDSYCFLFFKNKN